MSDVKASCRFCGAPLHLLLIDLGEQPLANSFLRPNELLSPEPLYPLRVRVCERCFLVQTDETISPAAIFTEYAYFSSYSAGWLRHAREYCTMAIERFGLSSSSRVIEVASNDGYLLQNFVASGIPCLGIEPAENVASIARARGVPTITAFLGAETGRRIAAAHGRADLVCAANVLAHVPAIGDFVEGLAALLKPEGVITIEFPHLLRLIEEVQFDTIYHEHYSYLSLVAVEPIFHAHGMRFFDCETLPTHGGSLRIFAQHEDAPRLYPETIGLSRVRAAEGNAGLDRVDGYKAFGARVGEAIASLREFLATAARSGKRVVAYGAAAKGNTLLNSCEVAPGQIDYVVDRNPRKQGRVLPGRHIPIHAPDRIAATRPDYVLILPWNLKDEIIEQMRFIGDWGGRFVTPIPTVEILDPR